MRLFGTSIDNCGSGKLTVPLLQTLASWSKNGGGFGKSGGGPSKRAEDLQVTCHVFFLAENTRACWPTSLRSKEGSNESEHTAINVALLRLRLRADVTIT